MRLTVLGASGTYPRPGGATNGFLIQEEGINPGFYLGEIPFDCVLPWSHLSCVISETFLKAEYEKALKRETTADCNVAGCVMCGLQERDAGCVPVRLGVKSG